MNGLGNVDQIPLIADPLPELQELICKQYPGPRAWHVAVSFEERLYLLGGKNTQNVLNADTWYREPTMPVSRFLVKPVTNTPDYLFRCVLV